MELWSALHDLPPFWDRAHIILLSGTVAAVILLAWLSRSKLKIGDRSAGSAITTAEELREARRAENSSNYIMLVILAALF